MLTAPVKWLINLIALLPDVVRPGVFIAVLVLIVWFVAIQRGLPNLWHATCRGSARVADLTIGVVLLPEYLMTTSRQRRGQGPGEAVFAISGVADRALDGVAGFYERHQRDRIQWKHLPWLPCLAIVVVCTIPWIVMGRLPVSSEARVQLAKAFDHWRDVEAWADVDPSRRAAPGISWPPPPVAASVRQHGRVLGVTLRCQANKHCVGRIILRTSSGKRLHSRVVNVKAGSFATVHMHLSTAQAHHRTTVRIGRAQPA